jgi:hypothetical protein
MNIRSWWYLTKKKWNHQLDLPKDVKEFVIKRAIKRMQSVHRELTSKEQEEFANLEMNAFLLNEPGTFTPGTMDELVGDAMERLAEIPLEHCVLCNRPVFRHKATKTDSGYLCENCAAA